MKKFDKIYIEITNKCNMRCSFCSISKREKRELTIDEFDIILSKINKYTDLICLHIKGEPLLYSNLSSVFDITRKYGLKIILTTNGTLLSEKYELLIKNCDVIRQINISVHAFFNMNEYLNNVIYYANKIVHNSNIIISYRLWNIKDGVENNNNHVFYEYLKNSYGNFSFCQKSVKLAHNIYLNKDNLFEWPNILDNNVDNVGTCYGLRKQFGILSNGIIVPCCLDGEGAINLGNIFDDNVDDVLNSKRVKQIVEGFKNNKKIEMLCQRCSFIKEHGKMF